jgi:putative Holliday junction resolvase
MPEPAAVLGIDLGERRTGLALSKAPLWIPSPLAVVEHSNFEQLHEALHKLATTHLIEQYIVGLPLESTGAEGTQAEFVRKFCRFLSARTSTPILLVDERLTSASVHSSINSASRQQTKRSFKTRQKGASASIGNRSVDAQAAQLILEHWHAAPLAVVLFEATQSQGDAL